MKYAKARKVSGMVSPRNGCVFPTCNENEKVGKTYAICTASSNSPKPRLINRNGGTALIKTTKSENTSKRSAMGDNRWLLKRIYANTAIADKAASETYKALLRSASRT